MNKFLSLVLLLPSLAFGQVAVVSSTSATSTDNGGSGGHSVSVNPPSGLTTGDKWRLFVVADVDGAGETINTPTDFTAEYAQVTGDGGYPISRAFSKTAGASESAVTVSTTGNTYIIYVTSVRISGAHATSWIGNIGSTNTTGAATTLDAPDITIVNDGSAALLDMHGSRDTGSSTTLTVPAGTTSLQEREGSGVFPWGATAYELRNAGSYTPGNWTFNDIGIGHRNARTVEYLPAAAGGASAVPKIIQQH